MTDTTMVPFYKSFLLGQTVYLDQIQGLPVRDLELLNVDTLAALEGRGIGMPRSKTRKLMMLGRRTGRSKRPDTFRLRFRLSWGNADDGVSHLGADDCHGLLGTRQSSLAGIDGHDALFHAEVLL